MFFLACRRTAWRPRPVVHWLGPDPIGRLLAIARLATDPLGKDLRLRPVKYFAFYQLQKGFKLLRLKLKVLLELMRSNDSTIGISRR